MARPNLLLCFDAFGTLFRPKNTVAQQYGEVARQCGLVGFSDDELQVSLLAAVKDEAKRNPNYGKANGLGATKWWTSVIHNTFTPLTKNHQTLPTDLAPKLLHRFSSNEGYDAEPNLSSTLRALRPQNPKRLFEKIVVGVVTNSDDRVPNILSSFGVKVSPLRYGVEEEVDPGAIAGQVHDIDFHCISYDVGVEKPDIRIFNSAELMLARLIALRDGKSSSEATADAATWHKVYVGDEHAKDVVGAANAGWNPVLLDTDGHSNDVPELDRISARTLDDLFKRHAVVRVYSIHDLILWLTGEGQKRA